LGGRGNGKSRVISGRLNITLEEISGDLSYTVTSGSINLDLPTGSSFNLDAETSSGSINVSDRDGEIRIRNRSSVLRPIGSNPSYTLYARTTSGSISINM
jgi:DUF4097 and DUF4098 domain-containing protein YvlB